MAGPVHLGWFRRARHIEAGPLRSRDDLAPIPGHAVAKGLAVGLVLIGLIGPASNRAAGWAEDTVPRHGLDTECRGTLSPHLEAFRVGDGKGVYIHLRRNRDLPSVKVRPVPAADDEPWLEFCAWPSSTLRGEVPCDSTLGPFDAGDDPTIRLELALPAHDPELAEPPGRMWKATVELQIEHRAAPEPAIVFELDTAIDDGLQPVLTLGEMHELQLWVNIAAAPRRVRWIEQELEARPDLALAVKLEVLHDGVPVAEGRAWWTASHLGESSITFTGTLLHLRPLKEWPERSMRDVGGPAWRLRVTPDEEMAARATSGSATRYWSGSIELPLRTRAFDAPWLR